MIGNRDIKRECLGFVDGREQLEVPDEKSYTKYMRKESGSSVSLESNKRRQCSLVIRLGLTFQLFVSLTSSLVLTN